MIPTNEFQKKKRKEETKILVYQRFVDTQGLYLNKSRSLVKTNLLNAIKKCTDYSEQVGKILVDLTIFCLESVIVQHGDSFYKQINGIVTGDNNFSTFLARIKSLPTYMPNTLF